jgi:anti-sigma factor RsiW
MVVLNRVAQPPADAAGSSAGTCHGDSSSRDSSSSSSGGHGGAGGAASIAADAAPWVALFARCFCALAGMLSQDVSADGAAADQPGTAALSDRRRLTAGMLSSSNSLDIMVFLRLFP